MKFKHLKSQLFSWFKPDCLYCHLPTESHMLLCQFCQEVLPYLQSACYRCALPLPDHGLERLYCGECLKKPPTFDRSIAAFYYKTPINFFIHAFKVEQQLIYRRFLSDALLNAILNHYRADKLPSRIIAVPLHQKRLKKRGFNQAIEIAKPISKHLKIKLWHSKIKRRYHRQNQHDLPAHLRKRNLSHTFYCDGSIDCEHIAIIDDVMTTGSTVNAIAKVLKRQGVKRVDVWCVARTDKKHQ